MMQQHEPQSCRHFLVVAIFKFKFMARAHMLKIWLSAVVSDLVTPWQPNLVWWYIIISQSVLWKKKGLLLSGSRSQQRTKMLIFVQMISSKPPSILFPNLVLWWIIMQELIWSKYDNVYWIFWTAYPFAIKMSVNVCPDDIFWNAEPFTTKLGMMMHHYEPDCLSKRLVCCVPGQGHS